MPGPRVNFKVMQKNPNAKGGCLCSPSSPIADCAGPYAVSTQAEMMDPRRPNAVIGRDCLVAIARQVAPDEFEVEPEVTDAEVVVSHEPAVAEAEAKLARVRELLAVDGAS